MIQKLFSIFAFVVLVTSGVQAAPAPDSTVLEVFITGIGAGKVKLVGVFGDQNYLADSAVVDANGHFVIRRKSPLLAGYYYFLMQSGKNFSVLLDNNEQFVTIRTDVKDFVGTMEVKGSLNTELLYKNFRFQSGQDAELQQLAGVLRNSDANSPEFRNAKSRQDVLLAERKKTLG